MVQLFESMQPVLTRAMKAYLNFLAQPQTSGKIAAFQKNYDDALIKKGFSEAQAFQLLRNVGNPLNSCSNNCNN
jgi:hypothetical protein